jgi:hypothetical protein
VAPSDGHDAPHGGLPATTKCEHVKDDGTRCRATRRSGSRFCFWHDPASRDQVVEAARRGAAAIQERRQRVTIPDAPDVLLVSVDEVRILLADTITQVRRGHLETPVANCIGFLVQQAVKVIEMTELERRLAAVEAALLEESRRGR